MLMSADYRMISRVIDLQSLDYVHYYSTNDFVDRLMYYLVDSIYSPNYCVLTFCSIVAAEDALKFVADNRQMYLI